MVEMLVIELFEKQKRDAEEKCIKCEVKNHIQFKEQKII